MRKSLLFMLIGMIFMFIAPVVVAAASEVRIQTVEPPGYAIADQTPMMTIDAIVIKTVPEVLTSVWVFTSIGITPGIQLAIDRDAPIVRLWRMTNKMSNIANYTRSCTFVKYHNQSF